MDQLIAVVTLQEAEAVRRAVQLNPEKHQAERKAKIRSPF